MSLQSEHPPLTWDRIEQLAQAGHDDFEAPINNKRARQLVESVREWRKTWLEGLSDATPEQWDRLQREMGAVNATLTLVRAALDATYPKEPLRALMVAALGGSFTGALASQPEAPTLPCGCVPATGDFCHECVDSQPEAPTLGHPGADEVFRDLQSKRKCSNGVCRCGAWLSNLPCPTLDPEAPKVPAAEAEAPGESLLLTAIRAANAEFSDRHDKMTNDLAAANARADAAERDAADYQQRYLMSSKREDTERRRADAAERVFKGECARADERGERVKQLEYERGQLAQNLDAAERKLENAVEVVDRARAERDQLAARVTELEALAFHRETRITGLKANQCTPEERQVLKALPAIPESWLKSCINASQITRGLAPLAVAILTNRAAKAKREAT